jgi:hypothetical protein
MDMTPEQYTEFERQMLNVLEELAPMFGMWLKVHPEAKNYIKVRFVESDDKSFFDVILQKPTARHASCPTCHGVADPPEMVADDKLPLTKLQLALRLGKDLNVDGLACYDAAHCIEDRIAQMTPERQDSPAAKSCLKVAELLRRMYEVGQ